MKYWPSGVGDPSVFGGYQVELSEEEKDRGSYITRRFKLSLLEKVKGNPGKKHLVFMMSCLFSLRRVVWSVSSTSLSGPRPHPLQTAAP